MTNATFIDYHSILWTSSSAWKPLANRRAAEQLERYADNVEVAGQDFLREESPERQRGQIPAAQGYYC